MSVTGDSVFTRPYAGLRFDVLRSKQGRRAEDGLDLWLADFTRTLELRHREIAAVILEPLVQGAGGMVVWPVEAVQWIGRLCTKFSVKLIFDEVMTGFGRTGKMFAFEKAGVIPDFVCLSKGLTGGFLPMGLTVTTREVFDAFLSDDAANMFFHGHSFTGNAISCAAAAANLEIFRNSNVLGAVADIEQIHRRALANMRSEITNPRVCGAIGAVDLPDGEYGGKISRRIFEDCLARDILLRPLANTVYLMPPYCAQPEEVENAWQVIDSVLCQIF